MKKTKHVRPKKTSHIKIFLLFIRSMQPVIHIVQNTFQLIHVRCPPLDIKSFSEVKLLSNSKIN